MGEMRDSITYCPLTQAPRIYCPIALSNYRHDAYTVLLLLKSGWWLPVTFENFGLVLISVKLCEDSDQNSSLRAPEYTHKWV